MIRIFLIAVLGCLMAFAAPAFAQPTDEEILGEELYFDENLSINNNQSCASCHLPATGFADPDQQFPTSEGSVAGLFGGRNAPSAAYAAFAPKFYWDGAAGLFVGGQFWDGRADTLKDQAAGPPTNPVEMALPDKAAVVERLQANPVYQNLFFNAYGIDLASVDLNDGVKVAEVYDAMAKAIGVFERTEDFTRFNSIYDLAVAGQASLTNKELRGLRLFNHKAKCALCHLTTTTTAPNGVTVPALFTDFTYDNLGLPKNKALDLIAGPQPVDLGLGGRPDVAALDPNGEQKGKFKVMSLRNIELTAPYGHNGVFETLEEIVHFYNTRDVLPPCDPILGSDDPGFGDTCWPEPEYPDTVNMDELGDLKLNKWQEACLVAFLKTLTDQGPGVPSPYQRPTIP